eukprot:792740-Lingulodinium_polyedra.AAC.1
MMRSDRPSAATTARKSHASRTPCKHRNWRSHGAREAYDLRRRACCLDAACAASALLQCCL